jgi:predicted GNAT family acetyltransferase
METIIELDRLVFKEGEKLVAEVDFPTIDEKRQITHTYVDEAYRGQGLAGRLLDELVKELRKRKEKAIPMCSYSLAYFSKHTESLDVVDR